MPEKLLHGHRVRASHERQDRSRVPQVVKANRTQVWVRPEQPVVLRTAALAVVGRNLSVRAPVAPTDVRRVGHQARPGHRPAQQRRQVGVLGEHVAVVPWEDERARRVVDGMPEELHELRVDGDGVCVPAPELALSQPGVLRPGEERSSTSGELLEDDRDLLDAQVVSDNARGNRLALHIGHRVHARPPTLAPCGGERAGHVPPELIHGPRGEPCREFLVQEVLEVRRLAIAGRARILVAVISKALRTLPIVLPLFAGCVHGPPTLSRYPDGAPEPLESLRGRIVVLTFWAEWCKPCLEEFPVIRSVVEAAGPDVDLKAVYYREDPGPGSAVYRWLAGQPELSRRVWWPSSSVLERFAIRGLPHTLVLAADGRVVREFDGAIVGERANDLRAALALARPVG
ncbi:MAG TPA: TlpA disulfide reductase family protein [Myxococcaceae bacterium]|nr:TlpA disulfide reductase family protein [Myxococcaceae bacterium]